MPWCACQAQAGAVIQVADVRCLVLQSYIGPVESGAEFAVEIERRWCEAVDIGTVEGPWVVALNVTTAAGPGIERDCLRDWKKNVGWR